MKEQVKLQLYIERGKPLKIKKLSSFFEKNPDVGASVLEHTSDLLIREKPSSHADVAKLFHFLLHSVDEVWFCLYFECLLANETLYTFLKNHFHFETHEEFYHEMLQLAEKHPSREAKDASLAILLVLYDSFSENIE